MKSNQMTVEGWITERKLRAERQLTRNRVLASVGAIVLQIVLLLQFAVGAFRNYRVSEYAVNLLLGTLLVTILALLIVPERSMRAIEKGLHFVGQKIMNTLLAIILTVIFLVALPFGLVFGRRAFLNRHSASSPWVTGDPWVNRSTWAVKANPRVAKRRGTLLMALHFFAGQRNWFILIVATLLLVLASIIAFASSPVVAPFLYPLF